jgi:hypothetical protein
MGTRTLGRILIAASLIAAGLVVSTGPAAADFHLMRVDEVFTGTASDASTDFVELEMQAALQGNVSSHPLQLFDASGARFDCPLPADVPNQNDGDEILFATAAADAAFPVAPDFVIPAMLDGASGAVCFAGVDCASWGSFTGTTPSPAGTPFAGGIPPGQSIDRTADTNNSAADFVPNAPNPEANAGNLRTMTCQPFTGSGGGGGGGGASVKDLKAKVRGGRAVIIGRIDPPAPGDKVSLTFFANGSPLRKIAKKSATLDDQSRFRKAFRIPAESSRCKVKVRFRGAMVGQKGFRC